MSRLTNPADALSIAPLPEDLYEAAADLWVAAWRATLPDIDFCARRPWFLDRLRQAAISGEMVLAALDAAGRPLGLVMVDPATGWLDQIAVEPAARGTGAARALLEAAKAACAAGISLDVNEVNARARHFYAREGFVETGRGVNPNSGLATVTMRWRPASPI